MVPQASLFGDVSGNPTILFNNIRVYGTILLLLLSVIVFVGVKIVSSLLSIILCSTLTSLCITCTGELVCYWLFDSRHYSSSFDICRCFQPCTAYQV